MASAPMPWSLSLGLSILANTLAAFGASAPSLNTAYKNAHAVQFTYTNVTSTSVSPFDAGNYLTAGTLRNDNPVVKNYFANEKVKGISDSRSAEGRFHYGDGNGFAWSGDWRGSAAHRGNRGCEDRRKAIEQRRIPPSRSPGPLRSPSASRFSRLRVQGDNWILHGAAASGDLAFGMSGIRDGIAVLRRGQRNGSSTRESSTAASTSRNKGTFIHPLRCSCCKVENHQL